MTQALRRLLPWFLIVAFLVIAVRQWWGIAWLEVERVEGVSLESPLEDYVAFYAAGRMVYDGQGSDLYKPAAVAQVEQSTMGRTVGGRGTLIYFNPPFVAGLLAPLSALGIKSFGAGLFLLVTASSLLAGVCLQRLMGLSSRRDRAIFWLGYLSLYTNIWLIAEGQLTILTFMGWLGFIEGQRRGREGWSGAALALMLVKPQGALLPIALLVWKRRWRTLLPFALIALALGLISMAIAGPAVVLEYPRFLLHSTSLDGQGVNTFAMFGWNGFLAGLLGDATPPTLLYLALVLPTLAVVAWAWRGQWNPQAPRFLLLAGATIPASLLVNPHLYLQDLLLMLLTVGLAARYERETTGDLGWRWPAVLGGLWLGQLYLYRLQIDHSIPLLSPLIAVLMLALFQAAREHQRSAPALVPEGADLELAA